MLEESPRLVDLNLRDNALRAAGARAIAGAIRARSLASAKRATTVVHGVRPLSLVRLDLSNNGISDKGGAALCANCKTKEVEVYYSKVKHLAKCEQLHHQTFVQCQRIMGDNFKDVLGIARDSPMYYQMKKVQRDLKEAKETVARFDVLAR